MIIKLLTDHHLEFLSLKGGCIGSFESTLVKMPHRWKSHAEAHIILLATEQAHDNMVLVTSPFNHVYTAAI